jgi:predicted alpha/beta hydrolase family esterase
MKARDADILIVPGYTGSGPEHWQSRWEERMPTARRVEQADWDGPDREAWVERIVSAVDESTRPAVLVAHSCGVLATAFAAPRLKPGAVRGALLVAPPDLGNEAVPEPCRVFADAPRDPLPFPSYLIASRTDPYCSFDAADEMAADWGARLFDAGDAGHINTASGHGPWPEGMMMFARMMTHLVR